VLEGGASLRGMSLFLKGKVPATYAFTGGGKLSFFQIGVSSRVEEKHTALQRKSPMSETASSITLFSCEK
jgi:hypothetical protein